MGLGKLSESILTVVTHGDKSRGGGGLRKKKGATRTDVIPGMVKTWKRGDAASVWAIHNIIVPHIRLLLEVLFEGETGG